MLVVLAKLCTPAAVGEFTLGMAITAPVFLFSTLQLRAVLVTDMRDLYTFGEYVAARITGIVAALLFVVIIAAGSAYPWSTRLVILLTGISKACESLSDIYHARLQKHERMDRIAVSLVAKGILSLALMSLLLAATSDVVWGVMGIVLASVTVTVCYDCNLGTWGLSGLRSAGMLRLSRPHPVAISRVATLIRSSLLLGVVLLLSTLIGNVPRYFVEYDLGREALGKFAAVAYIAGAANTVITALAQAATPQLAWRYMARQWRGFTILLLKFAALAALAGLAGIAISAIAGRQILTILYRREYADQAGLLNWVMGAGLATFVGTIMCFGVTAVRRFHIQLPLYAAVVAANAAACLLLIPRYGLRGAGIGMLAGGIVQILGATWIVAWAVRSAVHEPPAQSALQSVLQPEEFV